MYDSIGCSNNVLSTGDKPWAEINDSERIERLRCKLKDLESCLNWVSEALQHKATQADFEGIRESVCKLSKHTHDKDGKVDYSAGCWI